jgi:hypothetical protein
MSLINRRTAGAGALVAVLVALSVASTADAATYYACAAKKGGAIRLVSKRAKCRRSERRISFNSQGLPGRNGLNGSNGRNGSNGANGASGTSGFTSTLPSGKTEVGTWAADLLTEASVYYVPISFNIPLLAPPESTLIGKKAPSTAECPGTVGNPKAAPGHLCIYTGELSGGSLFLFDPSQEGGGVNTYGTVLGLKSGASLALAYGTWAVTG